PPTTSTRAPATTARATRPRRRRPPCGGRAWRVAGPGSGPGSVEVRGSSTTWGACIHLYLQVRAPWTHHPEGDITLNSPALGEGPGRAAVAGSGTCAESSWPADRAPG